MTSTTATTEPHIFETMPDVQWDPSFDVTKRVEICNQITRACAKSGIVLHGPGPLYVGPNGVQMFIGNTVTDALHQNTAGRARPIERLIAAYKSVLNMGDPLAISSDVVCASLRLRLLDAPTVNGWPVSDVNVESSAAAKPVSRNKKPLAGTERGDAVAGVPAAGPYDRALRRPAMPGAEWLLYLQRPGYGHGVAEEHLEQWGFSVDAAFEHARNNAERIPAGRRALAYGTVRESAESMFTHNRVLFPERIVPNAPHGWIVGATTRHDVFACALTTGDRATERIGRLVIEARRYWSTASYPTSRHCWYVPPEGIGRFGENAEAIVLTDESLIRRKTPNMDNVHVRFGDRLHRVLGEEIPVRPAPRRVI